MNENKLGNFSARVAGTNGQAFVKVAGEIDIASGDELWATILEALASTDRLVLDLRDVTFIDSTGLRILVQAHMRLGQCPEAVVIRGAGEVARRALQISGIDQIVTIEDDSGLHFTGVPLAARDRREVRGGPSPAWGKRTMSSVTPERMSSVDNATSPPDIV